METSIFLAKTIGLFMAISTLAIIFRYKTFTKMESDAMQSPIFAYLSGFFILIIGILIVVSHQFWVGWPAIITVIGWLLLFKGLLRIFFPDSVKKLIEKKEKNQLFILGEFAVLFTSLYLIYQGFLAN